MKAVYSNLNASPGTHVAGIISISILPKEWLAENPVVDYTTGVIIIPLQIIPGKQFISISLIPESYDYNEKAKSGKAGSFYEISLSGATNNLDAPTQQILETLRYHEFIAIACDKQKRKKVIGTKEDGMKLQVAHKQESKQGGTQTLTIELIMESEDLPPFYEV